MLKTELIVKEDLSQKGFKVIKQGILGLPDFYCVKDDKRFFVEVKTPKDGLRFNQLNKISELNMRGFNTFIFVNDDGEVFKYKIYIDITKITEIDENDLSFIKIKRPNYTLKEDFLLINKKISNPTKLRLRDNKIKIKEKSKEKSKMKQRLSVTIEESIVKLVDKQIDGVIIKNRSHAIEYLLSKALAKKGDKNPNVPNS